jgi:(R,R)-butanediol dehydrogenase / meso-butanediol dehydrogenase / diacetyl reductase
VRELTGDEGSIWEGPVEIDPNEIVLSELHVVGTIAHTPQDFADTITMLREGRIATDGIVTGRIGLSEIVAGGLEELTDQEDPHVKILVRSAE